LGEIRAGSKFSITTKISNEVRDLESLQKEVRYIFDSLKVDFVDTLLFHSIDTIRQPTFREIVSHLELEIAEKRIGKIGVSVYSENEILESLERYSGFKAFQINENILDQRKIHSKNLLSISSQGVEIGVRSIFLQGLLLSETQTTQNLPINFRQTLEEFRRKLAELNMEPLDACLSYAKMIPWASNLTIGVRSSAELISISESFTKNNQLLLEDFHLAEDIIVDPRRWNFGGK
jgi:aryl-alcohol dehydrogenase-like predicted oxidoreductase